MSAARGSLSGFVARLAIVVGTFIVLGVGLILIDHIK